MTRVAIVDDDPVLLDTICTLLTSHGWDVTLCCEGEEAFSSLKTAVPDLVVLNLCLDSPAEGWTLLRLLREDAAMRTVPVITYSGGEGGLTRRDAWLTAHGVAALSGRYAFNPSSNGREPVSAESRAGDRDGMSSPPSGSGHVRELAVQLLGGFKVSVGDAEVPDSAWSLRKARQLVKLLSLAPQHRLHRERIMDLLWPDSEIEAATRNLHTALHAARHALEPALPARSPSSYLHLRRDFLVLDGIPPLGTDVEAFQAMGRVARDTHSPAAYEAALAIYLGDLLPEDPNEDWAAGYRETIASERFQLLLELAQLREEHGEWELAVAALRQVVGTNPAHEEAQAALMRLLARTGRHGQALCQYRQLCQALRRELDTAPAPETLALNQRIRAERTQPSNLTHRDGSGSTRVAR